jgi:hypothetical protein
MNYSVMARVEEEINLRGEGARRAPTFRIMRNTPQVAAETHFNKYPLLGHKKVTYSR